MSRYKGTFIFGANFEGGSTVPIDARQLVCTYADLTLPATWCFSPVCSSMALYDGMLTVVASGACSGAYWLCDWTDYQNPSSWVKVGGGGAGTLTGATNGLSLFSSGTSVGLGGTLITGTTILNPNYTLSVSGSSLSSVSSVIQNPWFGFPTFEQTAICQTSGLTYLYSNHNTTGRYALISVDTSNVIGTSVVSISAAGGNATNGDISLCGSSYGVAISGSCVDFHTCYMKIYSTLTGGTISDSLLVWNSGDNKVKSLAISAITSGITGTLTGATNGLHVSGQDVVLGGNLSSGTTINISGQTLIFSGATGGVCSFIGSVSGTYGCVSVLSNCVSIERQVGTNCTYIDFTGNTITTCSKGGNLIFGSEAISSVGGCILINSCANLGVGGCILITAPSGASYTGNYCLNNLTNPRWIPDKQYVDNKQNYFCVCCATSFPYYITPDTGYLGVSGATISDTIYLPSVSGNSLTKGYKVTVADICGNALSVPIMINGNCYKINCNGCAQINTDYGSITLLWNGLFWNPIAFVN